MGFRFRKSIRVAKGVRLNFSNSGVSTSFGGRGFSTTVGKRGTRVNTGIPGTGLSYSTTIGKKSRQYHRSNGAKTSSKNRTQAAAEQAIQNIIDYVNDPSFSFSVTVNDAGEIQFSDNNGCVIEDKQLIALLKKHPTYKQHKDEYEAAALQSSREHAEMLQAETEAFLDIFQHSPRIATHSDYADALAAIKPEKYTRRAFGKQAPNIADIKKELELDAEQEISAILPWKRSDSFKNGLSSVCTIALSLQALDSRWKKNVSNFLKTK